MPQTVEEFAAAFDRLAATFGEDNTAALEECAPIILAGIEDNFNQSRTSDGQGWLPRKDGSSDSLLILSGALKLAATLGQIKEIENGRSLTVGVDKGQVPYAGVHQHGYPEGNIPAREYLGMSEETIDSCGDVVADHAVETIGGSD